MLVTNNKKFYLTPSNNHNSYLIIVLLYIATIVIVLSVFMMSSVPPVSRDALTHHLAVPKLWIKNGGIHAIPNLDFSYYPMNLNLIYVLPMLFGNDIVPKYIHFLFALGTAWMIYAYVKPLTNKTLGLIGVLLFLSIPVVVKLSISAYVDLGLVFFSWAALVHFIKWFRDSKKNWHLILSAIFTGLGLGTKYNGLIPLALLTFFVPVAYIRSNGTNHINAKSVIGYPAIFFMIALTVFSPWMIRNYNITGNPVYPLYKHRLGFKNQSNEISNQSMKPWLQRKLIYKETAFETAMIPIRIFFQGQDDNPRYFDGKLTPLLFFFPLGLLLWRKCSDRQFTVEIAFLFTYAILFILFASFLVDMRIRYIAPTIPPLVVLSVIGLANMWRWASGIEYQRIRRVIIWLIAASVITGLVMNGRYVAELFKFVNPVPYMMGKISRENYLRTFLPEFDTIQFANQIPSDSVRILALFVGKRLYYFDHPVEFMAQGFKKMVESSSDATGLAEHLQKSGFSHCMVGIHHFNNFANRMFSDRGKRVVSQWMENDCKLLYFKNDYALFELTPVNRVDSEPPRINPQKSIENSPVRNRDK